MGRTARKPHELRIVRKDRGAYCSYRGRKYYLGPWNAEADDPSPEAVKRFEEMRALWRVDPHGVLADEPLLIEIWTDWLASPQAPIGRPEDTRRVTRSLFGTEKDPGPYFSTAADDFSASDFLDWQTSLCQRGLSRWTVGQCRRLVLACFDWASVKGLVDELRPASLARVKPPGRGTVKEAEPRKPAADSELAELLPHLGPGARAACDLLWCTGARPSELLGLKIGEIVRGGSIRTAKGFDFPLPRGLWAAVRPKHKMQRRGFDRVLFFGRRGKAILKPLIEGRNPEAFVLRTRLGTPYTPQSLALSMRMACEREGLAVITPYQIRHGAAVAAMQRFAEFEVGCWLGHRSRAITGTYAGTDLRTAAKVALAVG